LWRNLKLQDLKYALFASRPEPRYGCVAIHLKFQNKVYGLFGRLHVFWSRDFSSRAIGQSPRKLCTAIQHMMNHNATQCVFIYLLRIPPHESLSSFHAVAFILKFGTPRFELGYHQRQKLDKVPSCYPTMSFKLSNKVTASKITFASALLSSRFESEQYA